MLSLDACPVVKRKYPQTPLLKASPFFIFASVRRLKIRVFDFVYNQNKLLKKAIAID